MITKTLEMFILENSFIIEIIGILLIVFIFLLLLWNEHSNNKKLVELINMLNNQRKSDKDTIMELGKIIDEQDKEFNR